MGGQWGGWQGESEKILYRCSHCADEVASKKLLCENCSTMEKRKSMHAENEAITPGWTCNFCTRLAKKVVSTT